MTDLKEMPTPQLLSLSLNVETVNELLEKYNGLQAIYHTTPEELCSTVQGLELDQARQLMASLELGRRFFLLPPNEKPTITTPQDAVKLLAPTLSYQDKEIFLAVYLNVKNRVLAIETISIGSLNSSMAHPREIFKPAFRLSANSFLVAHNHPSTDVRPSAEDIAITARLAESGKLLGVELVDHLIICSPTNYVSLKELGYL